MVFRQLAVSGIIEEGTTQWGVCLLQFSAFTTESGESFQGEAGRPWTLGGKLASSQVEIAGVKTNKNNRLTTKRASIELS